MYTQQPMGYKDAGTTTVKLSRRCVLVRFCDDLSRGTQPKRRGADRWTNDTCVNARNNATFDDSALMLSEMLAEMPRA